MSPTVFLVAVRATGEPIGGSNVQHVSLRDETGESIDLTSLGGGNLPDETVDTFEDYRVILLSNGTVRAIPASTPVPTMPTGLVVSEVKISSVKLNWSAGSGVSLSYAIFRNNVQIALVSSLTYKDRSVATDSTYSYRVQSVDTYGQRSDKTDSVSAFIDSELNGDPVVAIRTWPATLPSVGKAYIRVNASDLDAQSLELELSVDTGTITETEDPSVWIYEAA